MTIAKKGLQTDSAAKKELRPIFIDPPAPKNVAKLETIESEPAPITPPSKKQQFLLRTMGATRMGRIGRGIAGVAVLGIIMGGAIGMPGASTDKPGVPVETIAVHEPRGHHVDQVKDMLGRLGEVLAPGGITREQAFDALGHVSFSMVLDRGLSPGPDGEGLEAAPGTRLSMSFSRHGFTLSATPAVEWRVDWLPDPEIRSIHYDFGRGTFTATASGPGDDDWYEDAVASNCNEHLRARMPPEMQAPGYDPWTDPHLEDHLQRVIDLFVGKAGGTGSPSNGVSDPRISFSFQTSGTTSFPIGDGDNRAWIEAGTRIDVSVSMDGAVSDPVLDELRLRFSEPVEIVKGDDRDALLHRMDLTGITLRPNAQVTLDYRLGPENTVDGVRALFALLAIASEPRLAAASGTSMTPTRLDGMRDRVQAQIDGELEPKIVDLILQNDGVIPGVSLAHIFGVEN